jgi:siroheme synthase (precorrin-2 oxidase/ferrochelatase)
LTKQNYGSIIVGTGQAGPPLAKRLCESVSELIPTMLEEQTVLKLIR